MRGAKVFCVVSLYKPLDKQLETICEYANIFDKCIVVDDTGKRNSVENKFLESKIKYVRNIENEGLCRTINKGIRICIEQGADWVVVMDQDSIFDQSILRAYEKAVSDYRDTLDTVAAFSPRYNYDRHRRIAAFGYKNIKMSELSGMMINVNALKKIGLYDERFFIDGLDYEWCLRARKRGYKIIRCNEAVLNHNPGETKVSRIFGFIKFSYGWHTPERYYYQFRGCLIIHKEYHNIYNDFVFAYKTLKSLILFKNKEDYRKVLICAFRDSKIGYFGKYRG